MKVLVLCVAATTMSAAACKKTTSSTETGAASTGAAGTSGSAASGNAGTEASDTAAQGSGGSTCLACEMRATNVDKKCFNDSATGNVGTTDPTKFGCNGFPPADQAKCDAVLACIRTSHCGKGDDATPCLCGPLNIGACAAQPVAKLPGACRDLYIAAANGGNVYTLFFSTDSSMGVANNLYTCDVDANCTCP